MNVNKTLIGLVIVLLLVAIIVFVNILLNQYAGYVMEWGSVSDWFIFLCNAIMAGAAVYAAVKAKNWISDKKNQTGFDHAISIMTEYDFLVECVRRYYFSIIITNQKSNDFNRLSEDLTKVAYQTITLKGKLLSSKRINLEYIPEIETALQDILDYFNQSYIHIWNSNNTTNHTKIDDLKDKINNGYDSLNKDINFIFYLSRK